MTTQLLKNADLLVTMDAQRRELGHASVLLRDGVIDAVLDAAAPLPAADRVLDLAGHVLLPGLINTHHHMFQSLTRALPAAQNASLFDWLRALYPRWQRLRADALRTSALTAMAELMLSGCTTSSDHLYLYPNDCRLDDTIDAAREIGLRFVASRGSMSIGESQGGLPPDRLVEKDDAILRDTRRLIETYHDPEPLAMLQIAVAPCSPFSVSPELMRASAELARSYGVRLHTHLAENLDDVRYSQERFGCRPGDYAERLGWTGDDVWHAHCVRLDQSEIALFARSGTGVAHCPCSNMRLASGIAPLRAMLDAGVAVGLGVDGSASNDGAHLLGEARQALLLQRVQGDAAALDARAALELATIGGARVLGRDDIGRIEPGKAADLVAFDLRALGFAGALADPLAALLFCQPASAAYSFIGGRCVVEAGRLTTLDLGLQIERHNAASAALLRD